MKGTRLVVASCGEDVAWTEGMPVDSVTIYNADQKRELPGSIRVPNVAREAGMYARHILRNWDDLAEVEAFVQGDPFDHVSPTALVSRLQAPMRAGLTPLGYVHPFPHGSGHPHIGWAKGLASRTRLPLPPHFNWVRGAQFKVTREAITRRGKGWWQGWYYAVIDGHEWTPWGAERLWWLVFDP